MKWVLGCFIILMMTSCSKCGSGTTAVSTISKEQYIATLDASCKTSEEGFIVDEKELEEELQNIEKEKPKYPGHRVDQLSEMAKKLEKSSVQKMRAIPRPLEDVTTLEQIWSKKADIIEADHAMGRLMKQFVDILRPKEEASQPDPSKISKIMNQLESKQKEIRAKEVELKDLALRYGFKVCFMPPKSPSQP